MVQSGWYKTCVISLNPSLKIVLTYKIKVSSLFFSGLPSVRNNVNNPFFILGGRVFPWLLSSCIVKWTCVIQLSVFQEYLWLLCHQAEPGFKKNNKQTPVPDYKISADYICKIENVVQYTKKEKHNYWLIASADYLFKNPLDHLPFIKMWINFFCHR